MVSGENISVVPVDKGNRLDFELLFETKGGPSYCWCMVWRMTKAELKDNTSPSRKKFMRKRISSGTPVGLLAYAEDKPVGWCSVAPRETYQRLQGDEQLSDVWSIACFYINREFRHRGLVKLFIENAKRYAKKNGGKYLEAYPVEPDSPSYRFMGFKDTFAHAGFEFVKMAGTRRHVMILKL